MNIGLVICLSRFKNFPTHYKEKQFLYCMPKDSFCALYVSVFVLLLVLAIGTPKRPYC